MREENYIDRDEVKKVTDQIWKSMSLLRGTLPIENHHVYLFLLSAYFDVFSKKNNVDFSNNFYNFIFSSLENEKGYSKIIDIYKPIVKDIPEDKLKDILNHFRSFNAEVLDQSFDEIFDELLYRLADNLGKQSGEFLLPKEISKFVMKLAKKPNHASIFNPFAGLASFAKNLHNEGNYYGQEINNSTWALGMLRLIRQPNYANIDYRIEDSIHHWPKQNDFDLVISNPPFGLRIDPRVELFETDIERLDYNPKLNKAFAKLTAEEFTIIKGLQSINNDGKVICITSPRILYRSGIREKELKKYLIEEDLIETIVSLPGGLLQNTGMPICILILSKSKSTIGLIRMIDASNFVIEQNKRYKTLDEIGLLNHINTNNQSDSVRYVSTSLVKDNEYNLSVQRYFLEDFDGIPLVDIVKRLKGKRVKKNSDILGKFIKTSSLKNDDISYQINIDEIKDEEIPSYSIKIEKDCVLVSTRWGALKPTLFKYTGTPIYIRQEIVPLIPVNNNFEMDSHYLIHELRSVNVQKQVKAYQNSAIVPSLNRFDLFEIKINWIAIEEQRAKIKGILELSEKFKLLQKEKNALAHGQQVSSFDEFASLKHSLGAPRQNILSNVKSLIRFFENNNSNSFEEVKRLYQERYTNKLIEDLSQIKEDINHISTILDKGEKGFVLNNYDLEPISIQAINRLLKRFRKNREKFKLKYEGPSTSEMSGKKAIKANLTLLKILISNIISNAEKHAFDNNSGNNEVIMEVKIIEDMMFLEIKNNGIPFPKNFDKEKFITKFSTASPQNGTGLGGYDINRIANYFRSVGWELILNDEDIFPVIYKFNFPIIPMTNE